MAERLIGSLIYDDHPPPRMARPWKDRIKGPLTLFVVVGVIAGLAYTFANYREEARVGAFLSAIGEGDYDEAYSMWEGHERYSMESFLEDWGPDGYYTNDRGEYDVVDSNSHGSSVIVYARVARTVPVAIMVDKDALTLSFSPENKYAGQ
jgi:hypothetical protein